MDPALWQQAEALFVRCADLPAAEQQAFLEAHCGGQPELREAVLGLLRGDSAGDAVTRSIGQAASELSASRKDRWAGASLGAYTLESRLAEGGMGVIYVARRSDRQYEQKVAVKLLTTALVSDRMRARFLAERQILADLNHPNIARLVDGGETAEGIPYLVMEFVDGRPIDEYCNAHRLAPAERIELFVQACSAVHYAHRNLVIHRDIKPSNILVTAGGVPKLLDFGIAKLLAADPADPGLTQDGTRLLTPRHASPEQILGDRTTTASDVYGLGLLLYELLCGAYPYEVEQATTPRDLERTIVEAAPPAPSEKLAAAPDAGEVARNRRRTVERLQKRLAGDLDTIVLKALRKEPERRYGSVQEFADDLRRFTGKRPILARRPTAAYLLSRYWQRNRFGVLGILGTAAAILLGGAAATVGFIQAKEAERAAVVEARNAEALSEFLVSLFREADPNTAAGRERSVAEVLEIGVQRVATELGGTPAVRASVFETLSSVYKARAEYATAEDLLRRALEAHGELPGGDPVVRARMLNDLGDLLRIQSRHTEAARFIGQSLTFWRESGTSAADAYADALNNISLVYEETGRTDAAREAMDQALRMREQLYEAPHATIANSLHNLAWHHWRMGQGALAEQYARRGVEMRAAVFGEVHPRVAGTLELLARIYRDQGKYAEAEAAARRAVRIADQVVDEGHPDLTFPLFQLARILHVNGQVREASEMFGRIVEWQRGSFGPDSRHVAVALRVHGRALNELAEYARAEERLREAAAILAELPGGSADALYDTRTDLADVLLASGRTGEAAGLLGLDADVPPRNLVTDDTTAGRRRVLAEYFLLAGEPAMAGQITSAGLAASDGEPTPQRAATLAVHARTLLAAGRVEAAIAALEGALAIYLDEWGEAHWRTAKTRTALAGALLSLMRPGDAREQLEAALPVLERALGSDHPVTRRAARLLTAARPGDYVRSASF